MIRGVYTLVLGVIIAAVIITVAIIAAVGVIGLAAKTALFGEPRKPFALQVIERASGRRHAKSLSTD